MSKPIQLSIAESCHENWDAMTAAEQGRFCASCQKQVIDFTTMSDAQLLAFFKRPASGSVCGRFYDDQLNRNMQVPKKTIPWIKYFFQFVLPTFLVSARAVAQGNVVITKPDLTIAPNPRIHLNEMSVPLAKTEVAIETAIRGKVVDENNKPIPYASIMIKGGSYGVAADSNGAFKLEKLWLDRDIVVEASSVGYKGREVVLNKRTDDTKELVIQLTRIVLSEVVVVGYQSLRQGMVIMGGVSRVTTRREKKQTPIIQPPAEKPAMIKVYPNPVLSGTAINIGCEKLEEGYYSFQLFNQAGQQLQNKQVWIDAEARIMNMEVPAVSAGTYILTLTHRESGKRFSEKVIIQ